MRRPVYLYSLCGILLLSIASQAQYHGDDIPGFLGLQSGTAAPPGLYIGNVVWVYPTDTIKDANGNTVNPQHNLHLTSTAEMILVELVTNYKFLGANVGFQAAVPWIKNKIQLNSLDAKSSFAFSDMFVSPIVLGWNTKRADFIAGYNLYLPTGSFSASGSGNTGLGMYGNEFFVGSTAYLDEKKMWSAAGNFALEFHTDKKGTNINVGDMATIQGGVGRTFYRKVSGPIPQIFNLGLDYYAQFKVTGDSGSDIPAALQGFKDRVFGLGPEFNVFFPKPRITLLARYEPEFGARVRTQGQTVVFEVVWVAKSLVKAPQP
jgi:hypothetical protein